MRPQGRGMSAPAHENVTGVVGGDEDRAGAGQAAAPGEQAAAGTYVTVVAGVGEDVEQMQPMPPTLCVRRECAR